MRLIGALPFVMVDDITSKRALMLFDEIHVIAVEVSKLDKVDADVRVVRETPHLTEELVHSGIVRPYQGPELKLGRVSIDRTSRRMAANLTRDLGRTVSAITLTDKLKGPSTETATVIKLVVNALPLPNEETDIYDVLEWRKDEDALVRHRRLRAWIAQLARTKLIPDPDELATLLDDYNTYMAAHHKKMARSRVAVLVTTTAEIIEDLSRMRLAKVVDKLFNLFTHEASVLEAELAAPGREIAYLAAVRSRFGRR